MSLLAKRILVFFMIVLPSIAILEKFGATSDQQFLIMFFVGMLSIFICYLVVK